MLARGDRVGVAVSGGADSVALLHVLHRFGEYQMVVLHVNHELRGEESDGDEQFVRELAANLGLPLEVKHAPVGDGNVEQIARDGRREFFTEVRGRLGLQRIALGHNKSDQAETVLYRFLRGSGLAGLSGMARVTEDGMIRPMLDATREEIREWLGVQGIPWREDSSNQNLEFVRNRLRLEVFNPQLVRVLAGTAEVARDEEEWWAGRIAGLYAGIASRCRLGIVLPVGEVRKLHVAEQRRLIRHAIREFRGHLKSVDSVHIDAVLKLLGSEAGHDRVLIPGVDAVRSFGTLLLTETGRLSAQVRHYKIDVKFGQEMALPYDGGRLCVNRVNPVGGFCANFGEEADSVQEVVNLDGEILEGLGNLDSLHVRNWEPGDEYRRAGHEKSEKIKSLFQEYRVLLWERRHWPVLVSGDDIVWARRFGAAFKFLVSDESRQIVRISYRGGGL